MTQPAFIIVGRVRKAHGIRGEVVVETITDAPDAIFASGRRVFAGTATGDLAPTRQELHVSSVRPFNDGYLVGFAEVPDRTAAERWRGRYLLLPRGEVAPPADDEVYIHELVGMRVELVDGQAVGTVEETYELPQGLAIDVRREAPRDQETVLLSYDERTIASVDREARVIVVTPPDGLLE
ncbi:MAG: 16S rRNA processing protein RimM [Gemmatimonadaceae bacterium]|nr:16S rRNA processing protein RimM [Gemmatimonadaceae bacterium]NUO94829.1 16S rRNA processing protein RimM [Gemmatimonadaceae bacterium]NUP54888.1 16S rRNA processing protein RimM [Gemmatimonadaceae bacterium]NUR18807.1 16S rRNA processing protein RimM [Gemmatimonadaceae bacterium]NUS34387.1 16S rRNA processing protein RimM [Gemmatimonadaceae bacterium]